MSNGIVIPSVTKLEQTLRNLDNYVHSGLASGTISSKIKEMKGKLHEIFVLQGMTGAEIAHLWPIFDIPLFFWGFLKAWKEVKQVGRTEDFLQQHLRNMATFDNMISALIPRPLLSSKEKELPSEKLHLPTIQYGKANNSELTMRSGGAEQRMAHSRRPSSRTRSPSLQQDMVNSLRQSPPARTLSPQNVQTHPEKIPEVPSTLELQPFVFPKGVIPVLRVPRDHGCQEVFTRGRRGAADDMSYRGQKSSSESNSEREISPIDSAGHEEDEKRRRTVMTGPVAEERVIDVAGRSRSRSRNRRMKHPPAVMQAREDQSAVDKRDGDNDGEVPTAIRRKPRCRRLPKSTEQQQPAGTSGRPLNVESAVTDEDCAP
ncbi:hypothetical protein CVT25_010611 [Psilocybe cyanescens]|uniref:Uncharacterized protein n=1 Tax=Psilocybe cyanescens TaxID=93625 RepID=A0A409XV03_PSICY|nr:hypothetical protein CVT25_010611 [Psilocybe cyanescens]